MSEHVDLEHLLATREERQAKRFKQASLLITEMVRRDRAILTETNSGYDQAEDAL